MPSSRMDSTVAEVYWCIGEWCTLTLWDVKLRVWPLLHGLILLLRSAVRICLFLAISLL